MYPPGRVIFIRPLKQLVGRRHRAGPRRLEKGWDAVWVTAQGAHRGGHPHLRQGAFSAITCMRLHEISLGLYRAETSFGSRPRSSSRRASSSPARCARPSHACMQVWGLCGTWIPCNTSLTRSSGVAARGPSNKLPGQCIVCALQKAHCLLVWLQMLHDHLIQSTIISALDKVIQKHPANPNPKKKDKRRRLHKKGDNDPVELAEIVVDGPEQQAPI